MQVLADRIVLLRNEQGISSETLARMLDVSHKTVVYWEKNRRDPRLSHLLELARILRVTPDYLVGWKDERSSASRSAPSDPPNPREGSAAVASARAGERVKEPLRRRGARSPRPGE